MNSFFPSPNGARAIFALAAILTISGCGERSSRDRSANTAAAAAEPEPATFDGRDQYQLARAISAAEATDEPSRARQFDQLRRSWLGKRYRWTVDVIPQLCRRAERCNVVPFERAEGEAKLVHGWLPRLQMGADSFGRLERHCAEKKRCQVAFEGTLSQFVLSTKHLTSLAFSDVEIVAMM